jgi:peptidase E
MADFVTKSAMPVVGLSAGAILIYPDNNTPTDLNTEK